MADAARTPAAKPRVRAAEPKRGVSEAIDRTPKLPKRQRRRSGSHGTSAHG